MRKNEVTALPGFSYNNRLRTRFFLSSLCKSILESSRLHIMSRDDSEVCKEHHMSWGYAFQYTSTPISKHHFHDQSIGSCEDLASIQNWLFVGIIANALIGASRHLTCRTCWRSVFSMVVLMSEGGFLRKRSWNWKYIRKSEENWPCLDEKANKLDNLQDCEVMEWILLSL